FVFHDLITNRPHHVAQHHESDALRSTRSRNDRDVDPHQLTLQIDERAARVSKVDHNIDLDEVFVVDDPHLHTALGGDDPHHHRLSHHKWITNHQHDLTEPQLLRVPERQKRQALRLHFDQRDVGGLVGPDQLREQLTLVV